MATEEKHLAVGPFGVFPMSTHLSVPVQPKPIRGSSTSTCCTVTHEEAQATDESRDPDSLASLPTNDERTHNEFQPFEALEADVKETSADLILAMPKEAMCRLALSLYDCLPIKSREERSLMHYWITFLSPLMIPIESQKNPFRTVIVPLALSAAYNTGDATANSALLHSVYALAAVSRANLKHAGQNQRILGAKHLQLSFQYLGHSISRNNTSSAEVVLAAITTMVLVGLFSGDSASWRTHLRGAFYWLLSIARSAWKRNRNASAIYQIFLCLETLRPAHRTIALELEPRHLSLEHAAMNDWTRHQDSSSEDASSIICNDVDYCLDIVFCITQPILEIIIQISNWVYLGHRPPANELESLESKIILNDRNVMHLSSPTTVCEQMIRNYSCLWYAATYIYFNRSLQKLPLCNVQRLVRQGIEHLDAIALLELGQNVSGMLWPAFIIGCETNEADMRDRVDAYFDKRETLGIGNVTDARTVVREVWRRRDGMDLSVDVSWHQVMTDLGIDILLS